MVRVSSEDARTAMVQAVSDEPSVAAVAASWPGPLSTGPLVLVETDTGKTTLACQFVSPEYFGVLGIEVLQGRGFMPEERSSNLSVAVVSEATARRLWPTGQAVGQVLRLDRDTGAGAITPGEPVLESRTVTVVGVVKDVAGFRIAPLEAAVVYVPTSAAMPGTALIARVHGDATRAQESLATRLSAIDPNMANPRPGGCHGVGDPHGHVLPLARVLVDGRARRTGAGADALRSVRGVVLSRGATVQGDRHPHGARRRGVRRHAARPVADDSARRHRPRDRRAGRGWTGGGAAGLASRRGPGRDRAGARSRFHTSRPPSSSSPRAWWPPRFRRLGRHVSIRRWRCVRNSRVHRPSPAGRRLHSTGRRRCPVRRTGPGPRYRQPPIRAPDAGRPS